MASPGIHIGFLDIGTKVLVSTAVLAMELTVVEPHKALIEVYANNHLLSPSKLGRLLGSSGDVHGEQMKAEWIGEGLYMNIQFKNRIFVTNPVLVARIEGVSKTTGEPWYYEVFP